MRTKGKVWWEVARGEESGCGGDDDGVVLCLGLGQACLALVLLVEALVERGGATQVGIASTHSTNDLRKTASLFLGTEYMR